MSLPIHQVLMSNTPVPMQVLYNSHTQQVLSMWSEDGEKDLTIEYQHLKPTILKDIKANRGFIRDIPKALFILADWFYVMPISCDDNVDSKRLDLSLAIMEFRIKHIKECGEVPDEEGIRTRSLANGQHAKVVHNFQLNAKYYRDYCWYLLGQEEGGGSGMLPWKENDGRRIVFLD